MKSFNVLFVCTANRIRSPLAAALVNAMDASGRIHAESAGVLARPDSLPVPEAVDVARRMGLDLSRYRSRDLSRISMSDFGLIVGFEFQHVARVVVDHGAPPERTFLLAEARRLLDSVGHHERGALDQSDPSALVEEAHLLRSPASFIPEDEIPDPIGGPISAYERTALMIREMCKRLVDVLAPSGT